MARRKHAPVLPAKFISAVHTVSLPLQTAFSCPLRSLQLRALSIWPALNIQTFFYDWAWLFFPTTQIKKLKSFSNKFSQRKQVLPFSVVMKWSPLKKACKNWVLLSSHLLESTIREFYTFRSTRMTYLLQNMIHTHIHFEKLSIP